MQTLAGHADLAKALLGAQLVVDTTGALIAVTSRRRIASISAQGVAGWPSELAHIKNQCPEADIDTAKQISEEVYELAQAQSSQSNMPIIQVPFNFIGFA